MKNSRPHHYLGLDVGERRIGVAYADSSVPIAVPLLTLIVDGTERDRLYDIISERSISHVIIGQPRNQSGEPTAQTATVRAAAEKLLHGQAVMVHYQDESLTSVTAEAHLKASRLPYEKADIDKHAAAIILQDFLDAQG